MKTLLKLLIATILGVVFMSCKSDDPEYILETGTYVGIGTNGFSYKYDTIVVTKSDLWGIQADNSTDSLCKRLYTANILCSNTYTNWYDMTAYLGIDYYASEKSTGDNYSIMGDELYGGNFWSSYKIYTKPMYSNTEFKMSMRVNNAFVTYIKIN
jgi:hypothetical protein